MGKAGKDVPVLVWILVGLFVVAMVFCACKFYFWNSDSGDENIVSGCEYLSEFVKDKIKDLIYAGENVVLREGEWLHYKDYVVVLNSTDAFIFKLASLKNQTTGYSSDYCKFTEIFSGDTYETVWTSEGKGILPFGGLSYEITMIGEHTLPSEGYKVKIDYPQTSGDDILSFENCICDAVTNYCTLNMIGNSESTGQIWLGFSERNGQPIEVTSGDEECAFRGKDCFLGFGGIVYPSTEYFNYDNMGLVPCNTILNLSEMQAHNDWVDGAKAIVSYLCADRI